jgi:hypothetical protein
LFIEQQRSDFRFGRSENPEFSTRLALGKVADARWSVRIGLPSQRG